MSSIKNTNSNSNFLKHNWENRITIEEKFEGKSTKFEFKGEKCSYMQKKRAGSIIKNAKTYIDTAHGKIQ